MSMADENQSPPVEGGEHPPNAAELEARIVALTNQLQNMQRVRVNKRHKVVKIKGSEELVVFEDWRREIKAAVSAEGLLGQEAADFVLSHLEGDVLREVRYLSEQERDTVDKVLKTVEAYYQPRQTLAELNHSFWQ